MSTLTAGDQATARNLREVRPSSADQRRNPGVDVMAVWREDVEYTLRARKIAPELHDEFRALCGAAA